jgi:hypothetical protein
VFGIPVRSPACAAGSGGGGKIFLGGYPDRKEFNQFIQGVDQQDTARIIVNVADHTGIPIRTDMLEPNPSKVLHTPLSGFTLFRHRGL